jgi:hypothetical protein
MFDRSPVTARAHKKAHGTAHRVPPTFFLSFFVVVVVNVSVVANLLGFTTNIIEATRSNGSPAIKYIPDL